MINTRLKEYVYKDSVQLSLFVLFVLNLFISTDIPRPAGCGISPLKFEMAH